MIKVLLKGHNYRYEVFELIRLFYFNEEINFVEDNNLINNNDILIENSLAKQENTYSVKTKIIKNKRCIARYKIKDIGIIDIKENNINKKIKIGIKQSLYESLSNVSTRKVPWGILTGVRPTKIVHDLLDNNYNIEIIENILKEEYKLSTEKANLICNIAEKERRFIYPTNERKFSLYVSIPFCPTRCVYCSFPSNAIRRWEHVLKDYTETMIFEIKKMGELLKDREIDTVYIGGGTPTSIPVEDLNKIIDEIYKSFGKENIREFTVEAGRPDTINKEILYMLKENDVDRISINPQTMNENTLSLIGRRHSPEDIIKAYEIAREIGFNTINMDIIIGLPKETPIEVKNTMEQIMKLNPDNLTVHTMAIKRASKLKEELNNYLLTSQENIEDMLRISSEYAERMELFPYYLYRQKQILGNFENIGYSKIGKECIYNILIMEERQTIIAVGAGGVSKMYFPSENRIQRVPNVKELNEYLNRINEMIERKKKYIK